MFNADQVAGAARWPLVRIAAHGETCVTVCGCRFLPMTVHWIGRSVVCGGDGCDLCAVLPGRGLFYLPVVCGGRPSILELGALSSSLLEQHCKLLHNGIQAGHVIRLTRRSAKSPVMGEVVETREGVRSVDLMTFVARVVALYHLPGPNPNEGFEEYEQRIRTLALHRAAKERERIESRSSGGVQGR